MIVYDKEQKEIVIPNGIGNINLYNNGVEAGYNQGKIDGIEEQKSKLESINITENGTYSREDGYNHIEVNVPDLNGSYDEGYAQGKTDGINEQKGKLESINITENGTYTKEDGYNEIVVDVPTEGGSCNLGVGEYGFDSNSVGDYELYASDDGYDGWSKMFIHIYGDDGAISVRRASDLLDDFANNIEVLDFGWNYYVGGIITEIQEIYTLNGNYLGYATYVLDNGFKIYRGKWIGGNDFNSEDQIKLGAYVIVFGRLQNNNGELGLEEGSQVVAYQECGGGSCNLGTGEYNFSADDEGTYELYAENDGYDGWSKMFINIHSGAIRVWRAANLLVNEFPDYGTKKYVGGEITEIQEVIEDCYKTYVLDNKLKIYKGGWFDGSCFNDYDKPIKVGDYVIVYGVLQDNNGELIIEEGSQVIAYQECTGGSCNLEDKWVTPSMGDRDGNNLIVVEEGEGYDGLSRVVINPQTLYNEGVEAGRAEGGEGGSCNLINPIVFSEDAGNTINAENVQIPAFVYEGNQYYNANSFNLADIEDFKIHILFKPNNRGDAEPVNIFGCEDTDWDNTTFGARIYQGHITFRMSGQEVVSPYTENAWYDVEMGYNTTKRWVIVNGETLLETEHTEFNRPSQTLMIGAINSSGNAFRPFYGKIAAIYIKSNANQVWLLPKEDGTMGVYWNNLTNSRNSISGENNARFEKENLSGDGMKSITWLGNLEDKWVTPSMNDRDSNGYIVVSPSEGYSGLKRTVINPQTIYNEGYGQGKTDGVNEQKSKLETISITENGTYTKEDGYNHIEVNVAPKINIQEAGIKLSKSTFTEVPEWADFNGITDMSYMFSECSNLQTMPMIDTSNVTKMYFAFAGCTKLQTMPQLDTGNVEDMSYMFYYPGGANLTSLPKFNCQKVTKMDHYFGGRTNSLTDVGGWENLKCSWSDEYGLAQCGFLTRQSCINVLNGLYDFVGNGSTETRTLRVHPNFLTTVGDEISIGRLKGWTITAE